MIEEIVRAKPAAAKGRYILSITLTTTMGPGIRVDPTRTRRAEIMLAREPRTEDGDGDGGEPPTRGAQARRAAGGGRDRLDFAPTNCRPRPPAGPESPEVRRR